MLPILFRIGDTPVLSHTVAVSIAFALAIVWSLRTAKNDGYDMTVVLDMSVLAMVFAILGAKVLFMATRWQSDYRQLFADLFANPGGVVGFFAGLAHIFSGGMVFYGGLIGAMTAIAIYLVVKRQPLGKYFDFGAAPLMLSLALARIGGCFLAGCCYGRPTDLPWTVTFPPGSRPAAVFGHPHAIHPTQLYHALAAFAILGLILFYRRRARYQGEVAGWALVLYAIERFLLEFLRGDLERGFAAGLSTSQLVSVLALAIGIVSLVAVYRDKTPNFLLVRQDEI